MKHNIILIWILLPLSVLAQMTMNVETYFNYIDLGREIPDDLSRVIDENNVYDPFIGSWTGQSGGQEFTFFISRNSESDPFFDEFEYLEIRYLITEGSNIIADTRLQSSENILIYLSRMSSITNAQFQISDNDKCNNDMIGMFKLIPEVANTPVLVTTYNKINVLFVAKPGIMVEDWCPNGQTEDQFPNNMNIVLDKN